MSAHFLLFHKGKHFVPKVNLVLGLVVISIFPWVFLRDSIKKEVVLPLKSTSGGEVDNFLKLDDNLLDTTSDRLYIHRLREFDRVIPSEISKKKNGPGRCVVFSCGSPGYFLTKESLKNNAVRDCDRLHFATETYSADGEKVVSTWCRVPLLQHWQHYFGKYERILYVDPDILYRDPQIMKSDCSNENGDAKTGESSILVATKPKHGIREMQMNWLLVCNVRDKRLSTIFDKWDKEYENVHMQDQTVFNKAWSCGDLNGAIKCVQNSFDNAIVVFHCGGYLTRFLRPMCMRKHM